ncbi:MAG: 50S ribosomal protein L25/general stress protein Ctc [Bacteroidales bacterium]|nr:50S ribosomal protein L25/general stress protein Ctc [Bacteroidales bacterium]
MKSIEINAGLRKETGKKQTKTLRKYGNVPCVMYGGEEVVHFSAPANDFRHILYTHNVYLINLNIDGKKYQAILKDVQFHPVTDEVLHIDFIQVFQDVPAIVSMPVEIVGNSVGIKAGGKLRQRRRYLKVKGLIKDLPESLDIDITDLEIGDFIKVGDLYFENLELLDPSRAMVAGVSTSRLAKGMEIEEEVAEGEEGVEAEGVETAAEGVETAAKAEESKEE